MSQEHSMPVVFSPISLFRKLYQYTTNEMVSRFFQTHGGSGEGLFRGANAPPGVKPMPNCLPSSQKTKNASSTTHNSASIIENSRRPLVKPVWSHTPTVKYRKKMAHAHFCCFEADDT